MLEALDDDCGDDSRNVVGENSADPLYTRKFLFPFLSCQLDILRLESWPQGFRAACHFLVAREIDPNLSGSPSLNPGCL